jgi:hypothetical protein
MSIEKITPETVLRRYRELKVDPQTRSLNVWPDEDTGRYRMMHKTGGCCAMGIMLFGEEVPKDAPDEGISLKAAGHILGVDYRAFYHGFDSSEEDLKDWRPAEWVRYKDHPDYLLGRACRDACIAAGYRL